MSNWINKNNIKKKRKKDIPKFLLKRNIPFLWFSASTNRFSILNDQSHEFSGGRRACPLTQVAKNDQKCVESTVVAGSSGSFPKQDNPPSMTKHWSFLRCFWRRHLNLLWMVLSGPCHQLEAGTYNSIYRAYNPSYPSIRPFITYN